MRRLIAFAIIMVLMVCLAGCGSGDKNTEPTDPTAASAALTEPSEMPEMTIPEPNTAPTESSPTASEETELPTTEPELWIDTMPPDNPLEYPECWSLPEVRDFMKSQLAMEEMHMSFRYLGEDYLDAQRMARMLCAFYVSYVQDGNIFHVSVTEYPGDRMARAYHTGDESCLYEEEVRTLRTAVDLVEQLKKQTEDPWELELLIHDLLAEQIEYDEENYNVDNPLEPPLSLTAVGALLNGRANSQGYADAFYLMASIAGLQADRIFVENPNKTHMANTIFLDGAWYVVDVASNDQDGDGPTGYRLFNVGKDFAWAEYSWTEEMEPHPIAAYSDAPFYYYRIGMVYPELRSFAVDSVYARMDEGTSVFRALVEEQIDPASLEGMLREAMDQLGVEYAYQYWHQQNGAGIFLTLIFE